MRTIVVGLGVQGYKRRKVAGADFVAAVDPVNQEADYKALSDVPLSDYDAAMLCVPDTPKLELLTYLVENGKSALVEKPLWGDEGGGLDALESAAIDKGVFLYTAYNHRFEPHYMRMHDLIQGDELGEIYRCRVFYGNGTANLVRNSPWRDTGGGVLPDLGSHMLDIVSHWFKRRDFSFDVVSSDRFECQAPDHVVLVSTEGRPRIEIELTLLMWRNHFTCDVLAEKGSAHIESLCKWGPSTFVHRRRVLPSGRPPEEAVTLVQEDPTWVSEYAMFKQCVADGVRTDLSQDRWLMREISALCGRLQ